MYYNQDENTSQHSRPQMLFHQCEKKSTRLMRQSLVMLKIITLASKSGDKQ